MDHTHTIEHKHNTVNIDNQQYIYCNTKYKSTKSNAELSLLYD